MLYSAQNQSQHAEIQSEHMQTEAQTTRPESTQQSLHRFWNISSAPSASTSTLNQTELAPTNCDDCGVGLTGVDNGMEVDGFDNEDHSCGACGKHVCFSCSVSNLGEQKRCLRCAGRNDTTSHNSVNGQTAMAF
jgi:hypothetical protein